MPFRIWGRKKDRGRKEAEREPMQKRGGGTAFPPNGPKPTKVDSPPPPPQR